MQVIDSTIDSQIDSAIERIDDVLEMHKRTYWIIVFMALVVFVVAISLLVIGVLMESKFILGCSSIISGMYWAIKKITRIRKEDIYLAVVPRLVRILPPEKASDEIIKMLEGLRKE
ncbi:MAG: hypothetical protein R3F48_01660 [Candidatus Zixiibacteriota bacterium]